MKHFLTSNEISKYEVQIKSAILLTALLLFTYSFKNHYTKKANGSVKNYDYTNTK
jgi:hypothetical protein